MYVCIFFINIKILTAMLFVSGISTAAADAALLPNRTKQTACTLWNISIYILALSVLKLHFDARKINKSMQNELFKRSNTIARRELGLNNTFLPYLAVSQSPAFLFLPLFFLRITTNYAKQELCSYSDAKNKCMCQRVMSQALPVDFHLGVYLLVLYRICADLCIFLSKRIAIKCIFSHYVHHACWCACCCCCCFFELCLQFVFSIPYACFFMRSRFSFAHSRLISFFTQLRETTNQQNKKPKNPSHHYAHYKQKVTIFTHN